MPSSAAALPASKVTLFPAEDDLVVLNGCVISACNYLAVVKTQHTLDPNFWAKILLVRYKNHPAGHAYCVWETDGTIYDYDRNAGSFPIPVYTREPKVIATVLADGLSKILKDTCSWPRRNSSSRRKRISINSEAHRKSAESAEDAEERGKAKRLPLR